MLKEQVKYSNVKYVLYWSSEMTAFKIGKKKYKDNVKWLSSIFRVSATFSLLNLYMHISVSCLGEQLMPHSKSLLCQMMPNFSQL